MNIDGKPNESVQEKKTSALSKIFEEQDDL